MLRYLIGEDYRAAPINRLRLTIPSLDHVVVHKIECEREL